MQTLEVQRPQRSDGAPWWRRLKERFYRHLWFDTTPCWVYALIAAVIIGIITFVMWWVVWPALKGKPLLTSPWDIRVKVTKRAGYVSSFQDRSVYKENCLKTKVNATLQVNVTATILLNPCDYFYCANPRKLGHADIYVCKRNTYKKGKCPHCEEWQFAYWTTRATDWGYRWSGDTTRLKQRLSIWKINNTSPAIMLSLSSPELSDRGFFTVCAYVSGTDPCGNFYLDVQNSPSTLTPSFTAMALQTYHPSFPGETGQEPTPPAGNKWYAVLKQLTGAAGLNTSCYACTLFPKNNLGALPVKPHPLTKNQVACTLLSLTPPFSRTEGAWNVTNSSLISECSSFRDRTVRVSSPEKLRSNSMDLYSPLGSVHPAHVQVCHPVCFTQTHRQGRVFLGHTSGCEETYNATCGRTPKDISTCLDPKTPGKVNLTRTLNLTFKATGNWPSDDGAGTLKDNVWLCADHYHQALPPFWSGTCALVELRPAITLLDTLVHTTHHYPHFQSEQNRLLREKRKNKIIVSEGAKFMSGILPWWGSINNAHFIDRLHLEIENLTSLVTDGFSALTPYISASRNMLTQHQMALDLLFAAQGGLCHVIGDSCCTFLPDPSENMSVTITHLNSLLATMKEEERQVSTGWDWWSWLTGGGWKAWVARIIVPLAVFLLILLLLICIIIPVVKKCITSLFSNLFYQHIQQYAALAQEDEQGTTF